MTTLAVPTALLRFLLPLATAALLSSCGGGGSTSATPQPPAQPTLPPSPAILLLAENPAGYFFPGGIAVDQAGTIYAGNKATRTILKVSQAGVVSNFVGSSGTVPWTDGVGERAGFEGGIDQLLFDNRSHTLYAIDRREDTAGGNLRLISLAGEVSTLRLSTFPTHRTDGTDPTATGNRAAAIAFGPDGALYAATMDNLAFSSNGNPHTPSYSHREMTWRTINQDGSGRLLLAQENGSSGYQYPADATATGGIVGASLLGLAVDRAGNGYLADTDRHAIVKITPAGAASIFAGNVDNPGTADGTGTAARFRRPTQIVVDKADNLYVLDRGNATVRRITQAGAVSTVVGVPTSPQTRAGDLPGGLGAPAGLALDDSGYLYVSVDKGILRIRLP